jgi:hypothetical protein
MDTEPTPERIAEIENAERAAEEIERYGVTELRCLACGGELAIENAGSSYRVVCRMEKRVLSTSRGI